MTETQDQAFVRRLQEGYERQRTRGTSDAEIVRGGMDSMAWLVTHLHKRFDPKWDGWVRAAFEDRERAIAALERLAPSTEDQA